MDAKKELLFIMNDLHSGGAQKALVSLLSELDYSRYQADLLLFRKEGVLFEQLPKEVHLLYVPDNYHYFDMPILKAIRSCMFQGKWQVLYHRLKAIRIFKSADKPAVKEQRLWACLSPCLGRIDKKYAASIGFLEKTPNYFCIEKTDAHKKILWIHTNYSNMGMQPKWDLAYFEKADKVVAVSDECAADLKANFPSCGAKIEVLHNIVSEEAIQRLARQTITGVDSWENSIVTVGRLSPEKGIDLAIEACQILKEKRLDFRWFFIGDGPMRAALEAKAANYGLGQQVFFLGEKSNPYPYVRQATVYVQPSRFEGKSIAIDEAKILHKPIIATDFTTVSTQLTHLENGYITRMQPQSIAEAVDTLLSDKAMQEKFRLHLMQEKLGTQQEIQQFYALIK